MKKILGAAVLALVSVAIIKKVQSKRNKKNKHTGASRHLHTGAREEAYFKLKKNGGGKKKKESFA